MPGKIRVANVESLNETLGVFMRKMGLYWLALFLVACNGVPTPPTVQQDMLKEEIVQQDSAQLHDSTQLLAVSVLGNPIPGLNASQLSAFEDGKAAFSSIEEPVLDGLGPVFNEKSCTSCHNVGAVGGSGVQIETRFGRLSNGVFDPLAAQGGSLIQVFGVGAIAPGCDIQGEVVPKNANVRSGRRTTALFGLGLVDAVPEKTFLLLAASQPHNVRGRVNIVQNFFTDPPVQSLGKFGWKSQVPSLLQFSADAYLNEMGITTTSKVGSRSVTEFSHEIYPTGIFESCDPKPGIDDPDDQGIQEDVQNFTDFMQFLAPPPRGAITARVLAGSRTFSQIGCATCHTPVLITGSNPVAALSWKRFQPYSDFLLHDMGALGDNIGAQGRAGLREMRTAPLWGLRFANPNALLHDGRAHTVKDAILLHDGQGRQAKTAFGQLSNTEMADLLAFLNFI
jgi:CxxC motif-containing protein (DUF1111 family)